MRNFYLSQEGEFFLNRTGRGQLSFVWEAKNVDGSRLLQFDEIAFYRALMDENFTPDISTVVSTGRINKRFAVEYTLHPTAVTRKYSPWYVRPFTVRIRPHKNERLLAFWEVDQNVTTGQKLYRHVCGIATVDPDVILPNGDEKELSRILFVISPSGSMVLTGTTDTSFDGE